MNELALRAGDLSASVVPVGAALRSLRVGERDLVLPFRPDELPPSFRGAVLAPWPNRLAGGRWRWRGRDLQVPITEVARGHALHGLVAWQEWSVAAAAGESVVLTTVCSAQPGYPFRLEQAMTWSLDATGLRGELVATNTGAEDAPYGCGFHPYLVAPTGGVDDWTLHLPASSELQVDATLIPTELVDVPEGHDFRSPRPVGATRIDHAFTGFETHRVTVTDANGDGAAVVFGPGTPWVQVCTSDWPGEPGHRAGLAVEPMTCPPDAFNSGTDLVVLAPGATHRTWWRIEPVSRPLSPGGG